MRKTGFLFRVFIAPLALAVGIAVIFRLTMFQVYSIPSGSMAPTLVEGDQILVTPYRVPFSSRPQRGDVVVFRSDADGVFVVKRVIATPGDHVEIRNNRVRLNGRTLAEPYAVSQYAIGERGPDIIPAGAVFVLGDNRGNSVDSRTFGPVERQSIIGKVRCVLWSSRSNHDPARASERVESSSSGRRDFRLLRLID